MRLKTLSLRKEDGILIIAISRPQVLNAINSQVLRELDNALTQAESDEEIRVIIITGSGKKAFTVGADINELKHIDTISKFREHLRLGHRVLNKIEHLKKPVIAAINGYALGGGCELAMACDVTIASENAVFSQLELNLGFLPGWGGTQRLPRLVGQSKAKEMIFTGEMISAYEAERIHLVNKVVPEENLMIEAKNLAKKLCEKPQVALKLAKELINRSGITSLTSGLLYEFKRNILLFEKGECTERLFRFLEKQKTKFSK